MLPDQLATLQSSGLRVTPIRRQIFRLLNRSKTPISASDMLSEISANKTTIYREIDVLLKTGFLNEVDLSDGFKRYELASRNHHHHLICLKCRQVKDVILEEDLSRTESRISKSNKFKVTKHQLEFFGYCQHCL